MTIIVNLTTPADGDTLKVVKDPVDPKTNPTLPDLPPDPPPELPEVVPPAPSMDPRKFYGTPRGNTSRDALDEPGIEERTINVVATGDLLPLLYGKNRIGLKVGWPWVVGSKLRFPAYACQGRIKSLKVLLDGEELTSEVLATYLGTSTQTLDATLASGIGYTDAHPNVAYAVLSLSSDQDPSQLVFEIQGRCIYDPRRDPTSPAYGGSGNQSLADDTTWEYSTNPSLILADFHQLYRGDIEPIDWESVAECATHNDEILGGSAKRATCSIAFTKAEEWERQFARIREYAGVYTYFDGATLVFRPDKASVTVRQLGEADIIEGSLDLGMIDTEDTPDQVIVKWTNTTTEPWSEDVAMTTPPLGGAQNPQIISMSGFQTYEAAYRHAVGRMNRFNLINFGGSFKAFDEALDYVPGDVIELTHKRGLEGKKFTVIDIQGIDLARYQVWVTEYQPVWSSVVQTEPVYPDVSLPSPSDFPTVTGLAAVEKLWQADNGIWHTVFEASFAGGDWPHTSGFRYCVKRSSDSQVLAEGFVAYAGDVTHTFVTPPTTQDEEWQILVWVVNRYGNHDPATYASTTVTGNGKILPPLNIPAGSLKSIEYGQFVRLSWLAAADSDLSGYEIARLSESEYDLDVAASNDPFDNANAVTLIARIDSLVALLDAQPVGTWAYGVRPVDRQGNTALGRWVKQTVTADNAGAIGVSELAYGTRNNMSVHEVFGVGVKVYSDVGDSWIDRFGAVATVWPADLTEYWAENFSSVVTHSVESAVWDTSADRTGNWAWNFGLAAVMGGGAISYSTLLATAAAYPTFTTYGSKAVNAEARYMKAKATLAPAGADEGFVVLFPVDASYQGQILQDVVEVSILNQAAATGFTWNKSFTDTPKYWHVLNSTTPAIIAFDGVDNTGGNVKAWDSAGNDVAASIIVYAEGP